MKKLLTGLFSLILCGYCFAEGLNNNDSGHSDFIFSFDTGVLGINISYDTDNIFDYSLNANLANFYFENVTTSLGIGFFPINYTYSIKTNEHILSFSKLYVFWNLNEKFGLKISAKYDDLYSTIFGPFFSIQTLNLINFEYFNTNISYSAGIKLAKYNYDDETIRVSYVSSNIELGYNYFNNRHNVYFTIGLNPTPNLIIGIFYPLFMFFGDWIF